MTPTLDSKRRERHEDRLQAAVVAHLAARGVPGLLYWHTPNSSKMGGSRTKSGIPYAALRLKFLGLLPGVSDLVFLHQGSFYALELKVAPNKPTPAQLDFIERVHQAGGYAMWAADIDTALHTLEGWGLLLGSDSAYKVAPASAAKPSGRGSDTSNQNPIN